MCLEVSLVLREVWKLLIQAKELDNQRKKGDLSLCGSFHPSPARAAVTPMLHTQKTRQVSLIISHSYNSGYLRLTLGTGMEFTFHGSKIKPVKSFFCKC